MHPQEDVDLQREVERLRAALARAEGELRSLRENDARHRALMDAMLVGVYIIQDNRIVYSNAKAAAIFGYEVDDIVGRQLHEIVSEEDWPVVEENIARRVRGEIESLRYNVRGVQRGGRRIDIEVHGSRTVYGGRAAVVGTVVDRTDERRAEMALRASESRFQAFMENTQSLAYMRDASGRFVFANHAFHRLLGVPPETLLGKHARDLYEADRATAVLENDRIVREERRGLEQAVFLVDSSGSLRSLLVFKFPVLEPDGSVLVGGIAVDITDRESAERALAEQTRILQSILDSMGDGVAVTDEHGEFMIFNPAARRITGLGPLGSTPDEWAQWFGVYLPDGATPYPAPDLPLWRAMRGESTDDVEMVLRHPGKPDGAWITVTGRPLVDDAGKTRGGVVVFHDMSERRLTLAKLRQAEARYRALVEKLPVVSYIAGLEPLEAVEYVSPQIESLLGFPPEAWLDRPGLWRAQIHPDDRERVVAEMRRSLAVRERRVSEYRLFHRNGAVIWVHDEAVYLEASSGELTAVQGVLLDITDREVERGARKRLQALSKDLVAIQEAERRRIGLELHDEIGQLLTALKLRIGSTDGLDVGQMAERLREVDQLVDEAVEHVRNLSQDLRPSVLDDLGLLPALLSFFGRYTHQTKIRVQFEQRGLERRRFPVEVETAAYRIVQEALSNAGRHSGAKVVHVRTTADATQITIAIEDAGVGFESELAMAAGRTRGLAGMRERASLLHGTLNVESSPGRGCRVTGTLPTGEEVAE
jgi:PAS domain S-box-containing protein